MSLAIFNKAGRVDVLNATCKIQKGHKMESEPDWENILFKARVAITDNPGFNEWFGSLSPQIQKIVDDILDHDVTPEMICAAQECSEHEWNQYTFLQALGNGNPSPAITDDLTDVVLDVMFWMDIGT